MSVAIKSNSRNTDPTGRNTDPTAGRGRRPRAPHRLSGLAVDRRGAAAAEFALLLPLMTMFICGMVQYGVVLFSYNSMLNNARNGARALATGSATVAEVITATKSNLPGWVPERDWTITPEIGATQVTTRITVPTRSTTMMRLVPMPDTLDVSVVMAKQT